MFSLSVTYFLGQLSQNKGNTCIYLAQVTKYDIFNALHLCILGNYKLEA